MLQERLDKGGVENAFQEHRGHEPLARVSPQNRLQCVNWADRLLPCYCM